MFQPTVIIVDDHDMVRAGIRTQLGDAVYVVGEASDVREAVEAIENRVPDVVLLDVHLPSGSGADVVAAIQARNIDTRFLAVSVSDAPEDVIAVIRAGARGYVTKNISADDLIDAVRRTADGDAVFSPRLAGFVIDAFSAQQPEPVDPELDLLSPREQEVMRLLARGYAYKEVARRLSISIKTVETHASSVLRKLQMSSRHELTTWAARRNIL